MPELSTTTTFEHKKSELNNIKNIRGTKKMATQTSILHNNNKPKKFVPAPVSDYSDSEQEASGSQAFIEEYGPGYETETEDLEPEEARETLQLEQLVKAGYLHKKQERRNVRGKHWKRRWFVLRSTKLAYYKDEKEYELLRILDMNDVHAVAEVELKHKSNVFGIFTSKRTYYIQANDKKELYEWVDALNKVKTQVQDEEELMEDEDEGSQADSEEMASKQARIATPKRPSKLAHREPPQLRVNSSTSASTILEQPLAMSPVNATPVVDIPLVQGNNNIHTSGEGNASVSSNNSVASYGNVPSIPSSPSAGNFPPPERKDSSDPTASSEDEDGIYEGVPSNSAGIFGDESENNQPIYSGYLYKLSNRYKTWKKRWFVLRTNTLNYYKNEKALRVISLGVILVAMKTDSMSRSKKNCFKIITQKRAFIACAPNEEAERAWLDALQTALNRTKEKQKEEENFFQSSVIESTA
ncbi:10695_t:CDS:2 [Ambispora gerdemannii]|uniref:10695_t:CDS:1 n=1 Tax=Ambispora gerdemannii TaxID=144530 RepID=A0A9N9BWN4_9GLOM|nr:10695_t:CDS:2 [Ambispora gerdemannii]